MTKLHSGHRRVLELAKRDADSEGWVSCGKMVWGTVIPNIPEELLEREAAGEAGRVRLTDAGDVLLRHRFEGA